MKWKAFQRTKPRRAILKDLRNQHTHYETKWLENELECMKVLKNNWKMKWNKMIGKWNKTK